MLPQDAALIAAQKHPVAVHQRHPGAAVGAGIVPAAAGVHAVSRQGPLHMLRHRVAAKDPQIAAFRPQHSGVHRHVQRLSAGIHGAPVHIFIAHVVSQAQDPQTAHDPLSLPPGACAGDVMPPRAGHFPAGSFDS